MSPAQQSARERMLDNLRRRSNPDAIAAIARHSMTVSALKKLLPVAALLMLVALAIAPSLKAGPDANRVTYHVQSSPGSTAASRMSGAEYHGVDQRGQPFTLTANTADEQGKDNVVLAQPEGDITLTSGAWLVLKSDAGLFHQSSQRLGLNGNVTLYRNDGTVMTVSAADIDLKAGSAASTQPVQVAGPFGTLNAANGFNLTGHGDDIMFNGPVVLLLANASAAGLPQ